MNVILNHEINRSVVEDCRSLVGCAGDMWLSRYRVQKAEPSGRYTLGGCYAQGEVGTIEQSLNLLLRNLSYWQSCRMTMSISFISGAGIPHAWTGSIVDYD
jgi:hypothetical protein